MHPCCPHTLSLLLKRAFQPSILDAFMEILVSTEICLNVQIYNIIIIKLNAVAPLIADIPPANSTTMHSRLVCQYGNLCLGEPA